MKSIMSQTGIYVSLELLIENNVLKRLNDYLKPRKTNKPNLTKTKSLQLFYYNFYYIFMLLF